MTTSFRARWVILLSMFVPTQAFGQVTTYHYDNARTGTTLNETTLTTSNVNQGSFGKLFSLAVDGQIYAQPLYLPNVTIPQKGTHNVLYVATEHNSVYAFDADAQGSPLWQVNLGPSMPWDVCCMQQDLVPEIGITSTPVISASAGIIYVVAESLENNAAVFRLHALDVTTGLDKVTPAVIQGTVAGKSFDSSNGVLTFLPKQHYERPALLLANGNVYVGFGAHQQNTPFHGWFFSYNAGTLAQTGILCLSPDDQKNGIWQGGAGPAADAAGNVYLQTGDGPFDVSTGGRDYGDSVVKIGTSGSGLSVLDYFTPSTQLSDDLENWDLGSSGPLLIPGTSLGVAGGKDGKIYVFNSGHLGSFNSTSDQVVQEWQATFSDSDQVTGGFRGGSYAYYNATLYAFAERDSLKAFAFAGSQFNTIPVSQSTFAVPTGTSNSPAISISANGLVPATAIVWAAFSADGVADGKAHPGILYAFDAANVSRAIWNSGQNSSRDTLGNWAKWNPPMVANGKVYVGTYDNSVGVYGLLSSGQGSIAASGGTPQSATVNTGFPAPLQATLKDANNNPVGGVSVTFTAPASGAGASFGGLGTATAVTNANGVATAPALSANGQAGSYFVTATAAGVSPSAGFSLTNLAGAPASIASAAGNSQNAAVGTTFAAALQAIVKDANNNPLSGVTVTFTAPSTGAGGSFNGSASATATTNSSGIATAPALTANSQTGSYAVTATAAGVSTAASFSLTNLAGTPASIVATAGTSQSATVGTVFGTALQATVKDAGNNPMSGVTVTFTAPSFMAPATGAGAAFGGSATATATTNSSGIATAPALTANSVAGVYLVTAAVGGVSTPASFSLTNLAGAPASMVTIAGTPQSTTVSTAFATALQVAVKDAGNNAVSGVTVTFAAPATGAGATFNGSSTATATTNAVGIATAPTLTANGQTGGYTVTASAAGIGAPAAFALSNTAVQAVSAMLVQQASGANLGGNQNTLTVRLGNTPRSA